MAIGFDGVLNFKLFPAERQDKRSFFDVCADWPWEQIRKVVGDRGYDTGAVRQLIRDSGAEPVIPPRGVWIPEGSTKTIEDCYDVVTYRKRHIIERSDDSKKINASPCALISSTLPSSASFLSPS
jgi:hypothetical protein